MTTEDHFPSFPLRSLSSKATCYAGIGSRKTPPSILTLIEHTAVYLAKKGLTLRSGGAPGADTAFERGCDRVGGKKEIFLPWKGFNGNHSPHFSPPAQAEVIASFCHPHWKACSPVSRKFHARNCPQILGLHLETPVDFVLFWAPEENGRIQGGTATAVTLAREMKIPTFNLWNRTLVS